MSKQFDAIDAVLQQLQRAKNEGADKVYLDALADAVEDDTTLTELIEIAREQYAQKCAALDNATREVTRAIRLKLERDELALRAEKLLEFVGVDMKLNPNRFGPNLIQANTPRNDAINAMITAIRDAQP